VRRACSLQPLLVSKDTGKGARGKALERGLEARALDAAVDAVEWQREAVCKGLGKISKSQCLAAPPWANDYKVPSWTLEDRADCVCLFRHGLGNDDPAAKETLCAAYNGVTE
jgi:hypothetical protein